VLISIKAIAYSLISDIDEMIEYRYSMAVRVTVFSSVIWRGGGKGGGLPPH
jgi:hypothetical protein